MRRRQPPGDRHDRGATRRRADGSAARPHRALESAGAYLASERFVTHAAIGLLAALGLVLLWTRLVRIDESFWHDEVLTVLTYSGQGLGEILLGQAPYEPNNHILYNLLSWITTGVLVSTEALYRFWSVVPAIAAIAIATWWAWRRLGAVVAVSFAALAVAMPMHITLAVQARGYGLALLAGTLMLIVADHLTRAYSRRSLLAFLGAGLVGIWTLHIFAAAFVGQALALLRWRNLRVPAIAVVAVAGLLSLLFYAPVLDDVISGPRPRGIVIPFLSVLWLEYPFTWLVAPIMTLLTGNPGLEDIAIACALALVVAGAIRLWQRGDLGLALIILLPPLFFNLVLSVGELNTVSRHQFLLSTHMLLAVAIGIDAIVGPLLRYRPTRPLVVAASVLAVLALARATIDWESRIRPWEDFKQVAATVDSVGATEAVTDSIRPEGLRYYLGNRLVEMSSGEIEGRLCDRGREVVYIRHLPLPETWADYREPAGLECLVGREAMRLRVSQAGRGRAIDVWVAGYGTVDRGTIANDLEPGS